MSLACVLTSCGEIKPLGEESPQTGGQFTEGIVKVSSMDPALASTVSERILADQLYDGLTAWDARTFDPVPKLASNWEVSQDKLHWTFHLRNGAKASNGDPITALDVKRSLEHVARRSVGSPLADTLAPITGFAAFNSSDAVPSLTGIVVVDSATVRIDLDTPFAELPQALGSPAFGITHLAADNSIVSTGPYFMESRVGDEAVTLAKVPGAETYIDKVIVKLYPSANAAYSDFVSGRLDWSIVPPDSANAAGSRFGSHLFRASLRGLYLSFNLNNPKFSDLRFREAIAHAIDRTALARKLNFGDADVLNDIVTSAGKGSPTGGCGGKCTYDPGRSKELLNQIFGNNPIPPVNVDLASGAPFTDAPSKQLVDDLAAVGITATIRPTPVDQFGNVTVSPDRELFQTSWSANYPSSDAFLPPLFMSNSRSNVSGFKDINIDAELSAAQGEPDPVLRVRNYQQAERDILAQLPVIPLAQFPIESVAKRNVHSLVPMPTGNFDISAVWLARS